MNRLLAVVLAHAAAALLVFPVAAAAYDAEISPAGEISTTSNGGVTFSAAGSEIICSLTLAGSLEAFVSSIESDNDQDLGEITSVEWNNCVGSELGTMLGLEWNISYDGVNGTLPNRVSAVNFTIDDAEFRFDIFLGSWVNCLYTGDADVSMAVRPTRNAGEYTSSVISTVGSTYAGTSGFPCPSSGRMTGEFSMSPRQTIVIS